ncbi:MAG: hypothetical protein M1835_005432 [Candelina submexicana]|nr:MAG: hypothetical protein M1835_005432 [Candelina submexicana]
MLQVRAPQCTACLRRTFALGPENGRALSRQQIRGKKKTVRPASNIKVRLLEDVSGYGRQGAIVPVAAGRMRNKWYPERLAEYMTDTHLKSLNLQGVSVERDSTFRPEREKEPQQEGSGQGVDSVIDLPLNLLSTDTTPAQPQHSVEVLTELLPPSLDFYRSPITAPAREAASPTSPQGSGPVAGAKLPSQPAITGIYGSVSTADIALTIKALLAETKEGSRVVLTPEDITLGGDGLSRDEDGEDRLKQLGDFKIEINLKGASESLSRIVRVLPQNKNRELDISSADLRGTFSVSGTDAAALDGTVYKYTVCADWVP